MRKIIDVSRDIVRGIVTMSIVLCILALVFAAGYYVGCVTDNKESVVVRDGRDGFDLELPFEVEKNVVSVEEVESRLVEIGELSTYSGEYTLTLGKEETRYLLEDIPVLFSTNSVEITCSGIVKVGYNLSDIIVRVEDECIYISIPEAQLNDNYVIWDSVVCSESNNILNPIEFSQYEEIIEEIEQRGLEDVTENGIYQSAEDNLKDLIEVFLSDFDDYEIVYM